MAVYERRYRAYTGRLTPAWRRWLVIPRYAYEDTLASRRFLAYLTASFVPAAMALLIIFLRHNLDALAMLNIDVADLIAIGPRFFQSVFRAQAFLAFGVAFLVGPAVVSADLRHNALPLYLSRPVSRGEYVLGKILVVAILMSAVTWWPVLLLFAVQGVYAGGGWLVDNAWLAVNVTVLGLAWSAFVSLLAVTSSAWVKWKPVAAGLLVAVFVVPAGFAEMVGALFRTRWAQLLSLVRVAGIISDSAFLGTGTSTTGSQAFGMAVPGAPPAWTAWAVVGAVTAGCLVLLHARLKAYEVVG